MHEHIVNQLIISAGQWKRFGEPQYQQHFNDLLDKLRIATGTTPEGALQLVLETINQKGEAA
ncbi:hypothetical protein [Sporosarcina jiandibaonis]|uniref:hypothetical protein n=1 Tax=Sporosarcina jiandibaonis TaxID=2715535 RepID=UPI001555637A|nr:hypothetical protein [Sporosarcina jiandibaonis]